MTTVSAREAELAAMPLWVGTDADELGSWVLRTVPHAPGLALRRTNSCLAIGDPGIAVAEAAEAVRAFYDGIGREPLAQVEAGSEVERALLALGWQIVPVETAPFQVASVALALAAAGATHEATTTIEGTRLRGTVSIDGAEVASVRAELNGDWVGVHGLEVVEHHRRRGLARAVMAGLLQVAARHGATTAWLEVAESNEPALRLYAGLGFREHHVCRYLAHPGSGQGTAAEG